MRNKFTLAALALIVTGTAHADYLATARVVSVRPRHAMVSVPYRSCRQEAVQEAAQPNLGSQILGGVIGGAVGSQIGQGNGRTAATAAGAIAGTVIGGNMGAEQGGGTRMVERCSTEYRQEHRPDGYDVTYQYDGRSYTSRFANDPGPNLQVRVTVVPVTN